MQMKGATARYRGEFIIETQLQPRVFILQLIIGIKIKRCILK